MHPKLQRAFKAHKAWHEDEMKRNGYQTDFVFTTSAGQMYHQSSIRKAMKDSMLTEDFQTKIARLSCHILHTDVSM